MSLPVPVVRAAVRTLLRPVLGPPFPLAAQRAWLRVMSTGAPAASGVSRETGTVGGRLAERHLPVGAGDGSVLLLHGGAFVTSSPRTHRVLASHLAAASGVAVVVPDYRLAPEHPWPAAVDDAVAAYDELAARGPVAVAGDSAGGALALLLCRTRRPVALALVSPVTDLTGATSRDYDGPDALVRRSWLEGGLAAFLGGVDAAALSPLHADLADLPPVLVHVAEQERLRRDGELLVERITAAGGSAGLRVLPDLWHDAHLLSHLVAPAAQATAELGAWLGAHVRAD